jgi:hypothetical protein
LRIPESASYKIASLGKLIGIKVANSDAIVAMRTERESFLISKAGAPTLPII